jgi:DNA-binding NtrC family response regulator
VPIELPPLRERREDVPVLIEHFVEAVCRESDRRKKRMAPGAVTMLMQHDWPGNVRELKNLVERLVILTGEAEVIGESDVVDSLPGLKPARGSYRRGMALKDLVAAAERDIILEALAANEHHISNTAKELGLERSHLYKKMRALGINPRADE